MTTALPGIHRSREPTPGERGLALGRAQTEAIANTAAVYLRMFSEDVGLDGAEVERRGAEVADRLASLRPDLVDEICGIAAGANQPEALIAALNARTELLAGGAVATGGAECSVAGLASSSAGCVLAQTWDFHPDLARSRLLWSVELGGGFWFTTFTEAGLLAKTGLNAAGVGVALNFLSSDADGRARGLPIHVLLRMVLDGCRDAAAADRLIAEAEVSASACLTVAGGAGAGAWALTSYELTPRGTGALRADERGGLAHTNHFVTGPPVSDLIVAGSGGASSLSRLEQVRAGLTAIDGDPVACLGALLSSQADGEEHVFRSPQQDGPWLERYATLATLVYDLAERRLWVRVEDDPAAPLVEVPVP